MSQSYPAFVGFHSIGNCFGYVKSFQTINKEVFNAKESVGGSFLGNFRMRSCENPNVYCDLQIFGKSPFTNVFVNSVFADVSGFQENQEVILEKITTTTFCSYIDVAPKNDDDYSVIAQSQTGIEMNFLNQVRLVSNNMIIPYFVSPGVYVQLRILNIIPQTNNPVILNNETELHVQTVLENPGSKAKNQIAHNVSKIVQTLSTDGFVSNYIIELEAESLSARILPRKIVESWIKQSSQNLDENTIYIPGEPDSLYTTHGIVQVKTSSRDDGDYQFYYLHRTSHRQVDEKFNYSLMHMFDSLKGTNKFLCIDGSDSLTPYTTIEIQSVDQNQLCYLHSVDVLIDKQTLEWIHKYQISSQILKCVAKKIKTNPILLPLQGKNIEISIEGKEFQVKLLPVTKNMKIYEDMCFLMNFDCELNLKEAQSAEPDDIKEFYHPENYGLTNFDDLVQIGSHSKHLSSLAALCGYEGNHSLLLGNTGSGKSYFLKRLARRLANSSKVNYCKLIQCSSFKGKSSDSIEKIIKEALRELESRKPSVLFLDDFDSILPKIDQEQRQVPMEKVVSVFCDKLRKTKVNVIIVAQRLSSLNDEFVESAIRARPIIPNRFELTNLTQDDRHDLFNNWVNDKYCDLSEIARKSDGYSISEIQKLSTTINIECAIRGSSHVEKCDIQKALDIFVEGKIGKDEQSEILPSLDDVGGMFEQKKLLEQVIIWPKKYPKLFDSVGVPVSKGVLLYGPSGCGKTLLANAMISHSKFSVVNVKGPELLSKYIGASEENVRQVFEKARSCAPCILFFDELDSLAPKRGSDSTGVTDRVVNQLLTELDGAEGGMKGVLVLGCTSRIDLIDDALLRPGRFDHHVKCKFPEEEERLDILKTMKKKVEISNDVDLVDIARKTEGWSGADLQSLFTNAQFYMTRKNAADDGLEDDHVVVNNEAINSVFNDSQPKSRPSPVDTRIGQKVTLA